MLEKRRRPYLQQKASPVLFPCLIPRNVKGKKTKGEPKLEEVQRGFHKRNPKKVGGEEETLND